MVEPVNQFNLETSLQDNESLSSESMQEVPTWLNKDFIENILRKHEEDSKVKRIQIIQIGGKGESFSSLMFRVNAFYVDKYQPKIDKIRSMIIKTSPTNEGSVEKLGTKDSNVQEKEMDMYLRVLPEFRNILESIKENGNFYPIVLAVNKEFDAIVLEDLTDRRFAIANRFEGLGLNHVKLTLLTMARMHAASVVVNQKNPSALSMFDTGIFTRKSNTCHIMFESMCDALVEEVSTWEGYKHYAEKLKNVGKNLIENGLKVFDCDEGDLHVLTHGDLWTNNILFRYDGDGNPKDCVLIDFQMPAVTSPAVDLLYFLFGSTNDSLRENNIEELLQYYYYELRRILTRLNHDMKSFPTLHAFQMQIMKKYFYALTTSLFEFAIMLTQDEDASSANLMGTDTRAVNFKRRLFKDSRFQKNARMMLPRLDARGILDDM